MLVWCAHECIPTREQHLGRFEFFVSTKVQAHLLAHKTISDYITTDKKLIAKRVLSHRLPKIEGAMTSLGTLAFKE